MFHIPPTTYATQSRASFTPSATRPTQSPAISRTLSDTSIQPMHLATPSPLEHTQLNSAPAIHHDAAALQSLRNKVWSLYGIPQSKWPRAHPPLATIDTRAGMEKLDATKTKTLITSIQSYARTQHIPLPSIDVETKIAKIGAHHIYLDPNNDQNILAQSNEEVQLKILLDHIDPNLARLETNGKHGYGLSFADADILKVYEQDRPKKIEKQSGQIFYSHEINKKSVIMQQATRGCTAAVTTMLICDEGGELNPTLLSERNIGTQQDMIADFHQAGFGAVLTNNSDLSALLHAVQKNGPAIVSCDSGNGGHVVIVDAVDINQGVLTIRDPAHGWMVDLNAAAFRFEPGCLHIGPALSTHTLSEPLYKYLQPNLIQTHTSTAPNNAQLSPMPTIWPTTQISGFDTTPTSLSRNTLSAAPPLPARTYLTASAHATHSSSSENNLPAAPPLPARTYLTTSAHATHSSSSENNLPAAPPLPPRTYLATSAHATHSSSSENNSPVAPPLPTRTYLTASAHTTHLSSAENNFPVAPLLPVRTSLAKNTPHITTMDTTSLTKNIDSENADLLRQEQKLKDELVVLRLQKKTQARCKHAPNPALRSPSSIAQSAKTQETSHNANQTSMASAQAAHIHTSLQRAQAAVTSTTATGSIKKQTKEKKLVLAE
ncbi:MAG: hypothetical protein IT497_03625 [Ottowia sp.]|nr:hypothetical protein [Ottowia sp.]